MCGEGGCCSCCSSKDKAVLAAELKDGKVLEDRSCTDWLCIFIFILCMIGWIVVVAVAFTLGNPEYIVRPTNFRGDLCGVDQLQDFENFFVPVPTHFTYGICVSKCPNTLDYVCNNDLEPKIGNPSVQVRNTYYNHTAAQYLLGVQLAVKCSVPGVCTAEEDDARYRYLGLVKKAQENKCFVTIYNSGATLYRCVPLSSDNQNQTLLDQLNSTLGDLISVADRFGIGSFFESGYSECLTSWPVILICVVVCAILSLVWVFLLRWILAPIVYLCIVLVFLLLVGLGVLAYFFQKDLSERVLPGDENGDKQVLIWRIVMFTAFALALIYIVVMAWLIQRIRIAIIIMEEASSAFINNPGLVFIPPLTCVSLIGFFALFFAAALYIQTIGDLEVSHIEAGAVQLFGANAVNLTTAAASAASAFAQDLANTNGTLDVSNSTQFKAITSTKGLHIVNFFMFLWTANIIISWGFMIMALVVIAWYFSATLVEIDQYNNGVEGGRTKTTKVGTLCRAIWVTIRYHFGTLIFGSFLIALIQFIRALILYIERNYLAKFKESASVKAIIVCVHCCLACIERLIKIISYNAFIICGIKNQNFLLSAADAMKVLLNNVLRVSMLEFLSTIACFIVKVFIVSCTLVLAYFLLRVKELTNNVTVESGLFPMVLIGVICFAISSLFINVYQACIDTILMCFFIDEGELQGMFLPPTLAKIVGQFTKIGEAKKKYDDMLNDAGKEAEKLS